jgi:hypothetical protein
VARGGVRGYRLATWHGLRFDPKDRRALTLDEAVSLASRLAGGRHSLVYLQLPIGLWAPETITRRNQPAEDGGLETPLAAAARLGLTVMASAPLLQGELAAADLSFVGGLPRLAAAQCAMQFSRSVPKVATVLVGLTEQPHFREALEVAALRRSDLNGLTLDEVEL